MTSPRYLRREEFLKDADLGAPESIALTKSEGGLRSGRELTGRDDLYKYLTGEGLDAESIVRAVDETGEKEVSFPFVLSTSAEDRQRDVINQSGWKLDNYRRNSVVLFGHDASQLPVARASAIYVAGDKLKAVDRFSSDFEFARTVATLYSKGFLNAVSVGFRPLKWQWNEDRGGFAADFEEQELLEHSCVPVPAHQDALIEARSAGVDIAPVIEWAEKALASAGGLFLPKALIESSIAKTSSRLVVDFGDRKSLKLAEVAAPVAAVEPPGFGLSEALAIVRDAGFAVCTPDLFDALKPAKVEPVKAEPTVVVEPVVEEKAVLDPALVRSEFAAAFKSAFSDPIRDAVKNLTGRLD